MVHFNGDCSIFCALAILGVLNEKLKFTLTAEKKMLCTLRGNLARKNLDVDVSVE
jgi:hypothetical protein